MAQRSNRHGCTTRVLSASTIAVFLFAAAPAEAGWLGRGIAVGGVGYSVKKNLGELIDDAGEVLSGAIQGDTKRVEAGWKEVQRFPIKLIVDAFPILRIGSVVNERVASAKARVKQLFDRTGKAIADPRVALVVSNEEEARLLGGPRLPVVSPRHFAVLGTREPSKEPRGEPDKGLSQVPGRVQGPADHAAAEAGLGLTAEAKVLVQTGLAAMNYEVGPADGIFGKKTRGVIRAWQEAQGSVGTGYLTKEQAETLREAGAEARHASRERERKERENAEQQREAREAAERERLAREGREKKEAAHKAREQAASALKDMAKPKVVTEPKCRFASDVFQDPAERYRVWRTLKSKWNAYGYSNIYRVPEATARSDLAALGVVLDQCWLEITNRRGCYMFRGFFDEYHGGSGWGDYDTPFDVSRPEKVLWSGECSNGVANGKGTLGALEGVPFLDGKKHGEWRWKNPYGRYNRGQYEKGFRHGEWIEEHWEGRPSHIRYVHGRRAAIR